MPVVVHVVHGVGVGVGVGLGVGVGVGVGAGAGETGAGAGEISAAWSSLYALIVPKRKAPMKSVLSLTIFIRRIIYIRT